MRPTFAPKRLQPALAGRIGKAVWFWLAMWLICPGAYAGLQWETKRLQLHAAAGATDVRFLFRFINHTGTTVVIREIKPSCGCTILRLPPVPWSLAPGASGSIEGRMDLAGKRGVLHKTIAVQTSAGTETLECEVTIPEVLGDRREQNIKLAQADRQAIFKGDCAGCHVEPARNKMGAALHAAACGICHDAPHRASMMPVLANVSHGGDHAYWDRWIREGRAGSLMPAFGPAAGGPLDESQIVSLVRYLTDEYGKAPPKPAPAHSSAAPGLRLPPLPVAPFTAPVREPGARLVPPAASQPVDISGVKPGRDAVKDAGNGSPKVPRLDQ